jgi:predicted nucleic-acid-binding protein
MTILDTNIIVRHLTKDNPPQHTRADAFFRELALGSVSARLPEGVLVECVQVLESKTLYNTPRTQIQTWLSTLLRYRSLRTTHKRVYLRALELYATFARLSFVDSLCVAYAEREANPEVMTFDRGFNRVPSIIRTEP